MVPNRLQAIIWTNADPIHWRIYAALGGDESSENEASLKNMGRWLTWIQHLLGRKTTKASLPGQYKSPWEQQDFGLRLKLRSWLIFTGGGQGNLPLRKDSITSVATLPYKSLSICNNCLIQIRIWGFPMYIKRLGLNPTVTHCATDTTISRSDTRFLSEQLLCCCRQFDIHSLTICIGNGGYLYLQLQFLRLVLVQTTPHAWMAQT